MLLLTGATGSIGSRLLPLLLESGEDVRCLVRDAERLRDRSWYDDVEVATWNSRSPTAFGEVVDIGSRIDPLTRTFVARARVDNEADALRPGGVLVIGDAIRLDPHEADLMGSFFDLYFAMTSRAGLWTYDEMADWQREAGLVPRKPIRLPLTKGTGMQAADKAPREGVAA